MNKKEINELETYILMGVVSVIVAISSYFIFTDLKARSLYKRSITREKSSVRSEKVFYYETTISDFINASKFRPDMSDYYAKRSDAMTEALAYDLGKKLFIDDQDVKEGYYKAISVNPLNFLYHLKLGWFYFKQGEDIQAEKELQLAKHLYSVNQSVDVYLGEYYLAKSKKHYLQGEEKKGFNNFLLAAHYIYHDRGKSYRYDMKKFETLPNVLWIEYTKERKIDEHRLHYSVTVDKQAVDFEDFGFPHKKMFLAVKVYIKKSGNIKDVLLYKKYSIIGVFKKVKSSLDYDIYRVEVKDYYLDELRIETKPRFVISKIEIAV